jgi:3'(2'), 5'-bisphosphate nucleotidase
MRDAAMTATLTRLAREAGAAIMAVYAAPDFGARAKADASPVTDADLAADAILVAGLAAAYPDIPVVTEERAETHADGVGESGAAAAHFLVDPLDGTKEFVGRRGDFTVNVALIENGVPVAGVVYAPATGRLFRTDHGGGAVEEAEDGVARPVAAMRADPAALRVVASKSHRDPATDAYIARYAVADFRSAGSSLKFCLIATGEADLYPRLGRTMEWDTAAGHAVLAAAGGTVVRFDDRTPLRYGKAGRDNPHFIAHGPGVVLL